MKAIVIEDGNMTRHLLCETLFKLNVDTVVKFKRGNKALEYVEKEHYDVLSCIFLDINIKSAYATSFLDELMLHSIHQDIPIFILTDNHTTMALLQDLNHEICAYINKPFSIKEINECLQMARRLQSNNFLLETHAS